MKNLSLMITKLLIVSLAVFAAGCGGGGETGGPPPPAEPSLSGELVAGPLTEPSDVSSTVNNAAAKVDVFDFAIRETADQDPYPLVVTDIAVAVSGTGNPAAANITWLLNGPDVTDAAGTYSPGDGKVHFTGLNISIQDDDTTGETYTVSAYFAAANSLQDNQIFVLSINGDADITVDSSGSRMSGSNTTVDNGGGFAFQVTTTQIGFGTQPPAAAIANEDFLGDLLVSFTDANGYVDADASDAVTLSAYTDASCSIPASGTLSSTDTGGLTRSAAAGEISWVDLRYDGVGAIRLKATSSSYSACSGQVQLVQASSSGQLVGPSTLNSTVSSLATSSAGKVDVLNFTLKESSADLDTKPLIVQSIQITTNQSYAADVAWILNGPDATDAVGAWSTAGGVKYITFSGLNITINDNDTVGETYTLSLYFAQQPQNLGDGNSISWQMDADVAVTTDPVNSSLMTGTHNPQSGNIYYGVTATQLSLLNNPPAIAGTYVDFYGSLQVAGTDLYGNRDVHFNDTVAVSAYQDDACTTPAAGVLSSIDTGGLTHTTTSGSVTWYDLKYDTWEHIYLKFTSGAYSICSPKIFMGLNGANPSNSNPKSISRLALDASYLYLHVYSGYSSVIEKRDLSTGALVAGFGTSGQQWVCDASDTLTTMAEDASTLYVAGSNGTVLKACKVTKSNGTETQIINNNLNPNSGHYHSMVFDGTSLYLFGWDSVSNDYRWRLEKRNTAGNAVAGFGTAGLVTTDPSAGSCSIGLTGDRGQVLAVDGSNIFLFGEAGCDTGMYWIVEKRDKGTGALQVSATTDPSASMDYARAIADDANYLYIAGYRADTKACHIEKRSKTDLSLVMAFGTNGVQETTSLRCDTTSWASEGKLLIVDGTDLYIGGVTGSQNEGTWVVEKRRADTGALVAAFGTSGVLTANSGYPGYIDSLAVSGTDLYITGTQLKGADYYYRLEKRDTTTGQ